MLKNVLVVLGLTVLASCNSGLKVEDEYGFNEKDKTYLINELKRLVIEDVESETDLIFTEISIQPTYGKMKDDGRFIVNGSIFYSIGPSNYLQPFIGEVDGTIHLAGAAVNADFFKK
jgi:hypothetical protein